MPTRDELAKIFCLHMKNANNRAGGNLLGDFNYEEAAKVFLGEITEYAKIKRKNMFYTGANVENLVTQANRILKQKSRSKKKMLPYSKEEYQDALLEAAKGKYNQPYGVTNMKDIVEFWLSAFKNQYTNAGYLDLFPFDTYDEETCEFRKAGLPARWNTYDEYMFECISAEIKKEHKSIKGK